MKFKEFLHFLLYRAVTIVYKMFTSNLFASAAQLIIEIFKLIADKPEYKFILT